MLCCTISFYIIRDMTQLFGSRSWLSSIGDVHALIFVYIFSIKSMHDALTHALSYPYAILDRMKKVFPIFTPSTF